MEFLAKAYSTLAVQLVVLHKCGWEYQFEAKNHNTDEHITLRSSAHLFNDGRKRIHRN